jgi:hypothetical protein
MSAWEIILPHRLLVNRSLRKASEGLRTRIENYQLEYDREIERFTAEIEQAKTDKDRDFENVKMSLVSELSKDKTFFDEVLAGLLEYVDLYLRRQCLNRIQEIKKLEEQTIIEYRDFLTKHMKLIGEEIEILEARKEKLVIQAKVDDVIELIGLSGCDLTVGSNEDAQSLLKKVSKLLDACDAKDSFTKHALLRLCAVLQERVDFLPIIQYISWTIQQKKQLRQQLSSERRKTTSNKSEKKYELRQISGDIDSLNCLLEEQARTVREYWAIPIIQLSVQIRIKDMKLNRIFGELKLANERIQRMKREHSSDRRTWDRRTSDRIWREKADLKAQIPQVKAEIESLKSKRQRWYQRQQMIYTLCNQNCEDLISGITWQESDGFRIINTRLAELQRIEEARLAERCFMEESALIQQRKKEKETELHAQIESAEKSQAEKDAFFTRASMQLSSSKKRDTRFFLLKWFSDTEEVSRTKQALQVADSQKKIADDHLSKLKTELAIAINDFDEQIESCRPKPYRPTADEKDEIQQLENMKAELANKQYRMRSTRREESNESSN